jgi:hypothetical protein
LQNLKSITRGAPEGWYLGILTSRPDLSSLKKSPVSAYANGSWEEGLRMQRKLLGWLVAKQQLGLVTEAVLRSWGTYFAQLNP